MLSPCLTDLLYLLIPETQIQPNCVQLLASHRECLFCLQLPALFVLAVMFPFIFFHLSSQFSMTYLFPP